MLDLNREVLRMVAAKVLILSQMLKSPDIIKKTKVTKVVNAVILRHFEC